MNESKKFNWLTVSERRRRARIFRESAASCSIEGLSLSKKDQKAVFKLYLTHKSSDDMVAEFKRKKGIL